jgi:undecaprenyl-diphosphatase
MSAVGTERHLDIDILFSAEANGPALDVGSRFGLGTGTLVALGAVLVATTALSVLHWTGFDYTVLHGINRFSERSWLFDVSVNDLTLFMVTNIVVTALLWYVWFESESRLRRGIVLAGMLLSFGAGVFSRGMQLVLPTHLRPLHDPALHFRLPFEVLPSMLSVWSSYPSDHAAAFFGFATVIYLLNRRLGWIAFAAASLMNIARVYNGYHSPTDILGGAALGILIASQTPRLAQSRYAQRLVSTSFRRPALFYTAAFCICFGLTTLFQGYRDIAAQYHSAAKHLLHTARPHQKS